MEIFLDVAGRLHHDLLKARIPRRPSGYGGQAGVTMIDARHPKHRRRRAKDGGPGRTRTGE